jgi:hypothetical protein
VSVQGGKVVRSRGLALDDPPQRSSRTFAHVRRNRYTFHILVRDDPPKKLRGRVTISQRLGFFIQIIKPMIVGHMFNGGTVSTIRRRQLQSLTSVQTILTTPMRRPFIHSTFTP